MSRHKCDNRSKGSRRLAGAMAVTVAGREWAMAPLPMGPGGSIPVGPGVDVLIDEDGAGSVFLWGMAAWYWAAGDDSARRLAAVQLVNAQHASQRAVAEVLGLNESTLWRWRNDYKEAGTGALVNERKGPKGPWKLTDDMADLMAQQEHKLINLKTLDELLVVINLPTLIDSSSGDSVVLDELALHEDRCKERLLGDNGNFGPV